MTEQPSFWKQAEVRRLWPLATAVPMLILVLFVIVILRRPPSPETPTAAGPATGATVSEASVPLRAGPDGKSAVVDELGRGSRVNVLEDRGVWLRVRETGGRIGYLPSGSIEADADRVARFRRAQTVFSFSPLAGVATGKSWLLLGPFPFAARWGEVDRGATLSIYSVDHASYATRLPDGTLGFVATADVDIVPSDPTQPALLPARTHTPKKLELVEQLVVTPPEEGSARAGSAEVAAPRSAPAEIPASGLAPEGGGMVPAVLSSRVEPVYPPAAVRARIEGTVVLEIGIDTQGAVTEIKVRQGVPLGATEAAVEAVRQWRYRPARGPQGPVASMRIVRVDFRLSPRQD